MFSFIPSLFYTFHFLITVPALACVCKRALPVCIEFGERCAFRGQSLETIAA